MQTATVKFPAASRQKRQSEPFLQQIMDQSKRAHAKKENQRMVDAQFEGRDPIIPKLAVNQAEDVPFEVIMPRLLVVLTAGEKEMEGQPCHAFRNEQSC